MSFKVQLKQTFAKSTDGKDYKRVRANSIINGNGES